MDGYKVFTLGEPFPLDKMRNLVDDLHSKDQNYIVMVDPAVAAQNYDAYNNGIKADVFLKRADGIFSKAKCGQVLQFFHIGSWVTRMSTGMRNSPTFSILRLVSTSTHYGSTGMSRRTFAHILAATQKRGV